MAGSIKGITIKLGANATELTDALHQVQQASKNTQSSLDNINKALKFDPGNTELLAQKMTLLKDKISNSKSYVDVLKQSLSQLAADGVSKTSTEYTTLEREIAATNATIKKCETELTTCGGAMKSASESGKSFGASLDTIKVAAGNLIASGLQQVASLIGNQIGAAVERVDSINAYSRTMQNLGYAEDEVSAASEKMLEHIQNLPTAAPDIYSLQQKFVALNGSLEDSTDIALALNDATLAGGQGTQVASSAMEQWYQIIANGKPDLQSWKIINAAMPAQLKQIAEACLGTGASSQDLFEAWQSGTITTEQVTDALVALDQEGGSGMASFAEQAVGASAGIQTAFENLKTFITKAIADIITTIGVENITAVLGFLSNAITTVLGVLSGLIAVFKGGAEGVQTFRDSITALFTEAQTVFTTVSTIILQVAGTLVPQFVSTIIENLPFIIETGTQTLISLINGISEALPQLISYIPQIIVTIVTTLISNLPQIIAAGFKLLVALVTGIGQAVPTLARSALNVAKQIPSYFQQGIGSIANVGVNIIKGLWNGASGMVSWAVNKFKNLGKTILKAIKNALGIHSPSKEFAKIGSFSMRGLGQGIEDNVGIVQDAMGTVSNAMLTDGVKASANVSTHSTLITDYNALSSSIISGLATALSGVMINNVLEIDGQVMAKKVTPFVNAQLGRAQVMSARGV